ERVDAERQDQHVPRMAGDEVAAPVEGSATFAARGSERQREIVVEAFSFSLAALVGMAEEMRILDQRIGMQIDHLHVGSRVKDLLRAVAVMIVDVENGDARSALVEKRLCGDGGVVDV